jgi:hypothetical protein
MIGKEDAMLASFLNCSVPSSRSRKVLHGGRHPFSGTRDISLSWLPGRIACITGSCRGRPLIRNLVFLAPTPGPELSLPTSLFPITLHSIHNRLIPVNNGPCVHTPGTEGPCNHASFQPYFSSTIEACDPESSPTDRMRKAKSQDTHNGPDADGGLPEWEALRQMGLTGVLETVE